MTIMRTLNINKKTLLKMMLNSYPMKNREKKETKRKTPTNTTTKCDNELFMDATSHSHSLQVIRYT